MRSVFFALPAVLLAALASCSSGPETLPFGTGGSTTSSGTAGTGGAGASGGAPTTGTGAGGAATTSDTTPPMTNNGFPDHWPDGLSCGDEPDVTVWAYDDDTFILRQSLCSNFEGPFLYLLFGEDKVFLQDTGTGDVNVAQAVSGVIDDWLAKKGKSSIELVVTHSHSHGDHVGGDSQFNGLANTTVVGTSITAIQTFFGIYAWPTQLVTFELGNRTLDILPIPGHQGQHIAVYDKSRGLLLTGDTLYPGRLYINQWDTYKASIQRMVDFVSSPDHPVEWVLGTHIEMTTTPGQDFPFGADKHPDEHPLQLTKDTLLELHQALMGLPGPTNQVHDDFIIYPL